MYIWNRLYYGMFFYHRWTQILYSKILWIIPISVLYKLGILNKTKYSRLIRLNKKMIRTLTDEKSSVVLTCTDITILVLTGSIVWAIANLISIPIPSASIELLDRVPFMIISAILVVLINYFCLWRNNRYLEYFKEFRNSSPLRNTIWAIISTSTVIIAFVLFLLSFCLKSVVR